jgi:hypothetical protein
MSLIDTAVQRIRKAYFDEVIKNLSFITSDITYLNDKVAKEELKNSFEKFMKNYYLSKFEYSPLTGGFSLFMMVPPYLSGGNYKEVFGVPYSGSENENQKFFHTTVISLPFLAIDFSPPQISAKIDENKLLNGSIPVVEEIWPGNSIDVTYYETKELMVYTFHKIWMDYIEEVRLGVIEPAPEMIENGIIDYATAAFVLRFTPDLDLVYLGYLVGLVPTSRNPGDIVKGSLGYNEIQTVSIPYSLFTYTEFTYFELLMHGYSIQNPNGHPWLEKLKSLFNFYVS